MPSDGVTILRIFINKDKEYSRIWNQRNSKCKLYIKTRPTDVVIRSLNIQEFTKVGVIIFLPEKKMAYEK